MPVGCVIIFLQSRFFVWGPVPFFLHQKTSECFSRKSLKCGQIKYIQWTPCRVFENAKPMPSRVIVMISDMYAYLYIYIHKTRRSDAAAIQLVEVMQRYDFWFRQRAFKWKIWIPWESTLNVYHHATICFLMFFNIRQIWGNIWGPQTARALSQGSTSVVHISLLLETQVKSKKDIANFSARDADRPPQVSFKIRQKNGCRWILICKAELYYVY